MPVAFSNAHATDQRVQINVTNTASTGVVLHVTADEVAKSIRYELAQKKPSGNAKQRRTYRRSFFAGLRRLYGVEMLVCVKALLKVPEEIAS